MRQALDNGTWFETDSTQRFDEATYWDGQNHISCATGGQWEHETLFRTKGGKWVLNAWSQWQGSGESWVGINDAEAAQWLVRNGHEAHDACRAEYAALEI
jgi:hypothetical protein